MDVPAVIVEVAARPQPFRLSQRPRHRRGRHAHDSRHRGMFDLARIDITGIRAIVPNVRLLLTAARDVGLTIVHLRRWGCSSESDRRRLPVARRGSILSLRVGDHDDFAGWRTRRILVRTVGTESPESIAGHGRRCATGVAEHRATTETDAVLASPRHRAVGGVDRWTSGSSSRRSAIAMSSDDHCLATADAQPAAVAADARRSVRMRLCYAELLLRPGSVQILDAPASASTTRCDADSVLIAEQGVALCRGACWLLGAQRVAWRWSDYRSSTQLSTCATDGASRTQPGQRVARPCRVHARQERVNASRRRRPPP